MRKSPAPAPAPAAESAPAMSAVDGKQAAGETTVCESEHVGSSRRVFIDVIRKGDRRRGYITVRNNRDHRLEVGFSLCELKDHFNGELGLDIAFKRGERLRDKQNFVRASQGEFLVMNEDAGIVTVVPRTLVPRILKVVNKLRNAEDVVPAWVLNMQREFAPKNKRAHTHSQARKKGGG